MEGRYGLAFTLAAVTFEGPCGSKLAEFVSHHVFRHQHLDVLAAVVNHERDVHEFRNDRAGSCPCLDRFLGARFGCLLDFEKDFWVYKRTLLTASTHDLLPELPLKGWPTCGVSIDRSDDSCVGERSTNYLVCVFDGLLRPSRSCPMG